MKPGQTEADKQYSKSLFSPSDSSQAQSKHEQLSEFERLRRRRLLLRLVLPGALLLVGIIAFVLHKPLKYIFSPPTLLQGSELPDEDETTQPSHENLKQYGNSEALLHIKMRFAEEMLAPSSIVELAHAAVDSKPSEIYFTIAYKPPQEGEPESEIKINDSSLIEIDGDTRVDLSAIKKEEDFILALQHCYARLYPESRQKLELQVSEEVLEQRQQAEMRKPTLIVPEKKQGEIKEGEKSILLPDFAYPGQ